MLRLLLLLAPLGPAMADDTADPLFRSDEMLEITLQGPFSRIMAERSIEDEADGRIIYTEADGRRMQFDIGLRTRGNYRRRDTVCEFAPLRLNFRKGEVKDSLFHKQDKLKLVTHCVPNDLSYRRGVLREYLAYRIFNLMTDKSYRVRLAHITYEDTEPGHEPVTEYGILIEHHDRLAKRIGMQRVEGEARVRLAKLDQAHLQLGSVFQYLIGNTDFSPISSEEETDCCHNYKLFGAGEDTYVAIPYDFDLSGFVNNQYATPNPRFGIRDVKQRLYRGRCMNNAMLEETLARYREKKDEILALVYDEPRLSKGARFTQRNYLREFFKTIDKPERVQSRMLDKCV